MRERSFSERERAEAVGGLKRGAKWLVLMLLCGLVLAAPSVSWGLEHFLSFNLREPLILVIAGGVAMLLMIVSVVGLVFVGLQGLKVGRS